MWMVEGYIFKMPVLLKILAGDNLYDEGPNVFTLSHMLCHMAGDVEFCV